MIRFFDIILSAIGLIILLPLFLVIAIWINIDSSGPVFYRQMRVGKNGFDFSLLKFRSMHEGSEKGGLITIGNRDPRLTGAGYFIRKFKLDELPQLINVFIGEMSIVGPRPEVRRYVDLYSEEQKAILTIKPGITDYASIAFKNENEILSRVSDPEDYYIKFIMAEKIRLNMTYINNHSIFQYFKIILITIYRVFC